MVPLPGAGKMVASTNIPMWQWLIARKNIEDKYVEMSTNLEQQKPFFDSIDEKERSNMWLVSQNARLLRWDLSKFVFEVAIFFFYV